MHHIYSWAILFGGSLGLLLVAIHWWWEKKYKIDLDGMKIFALILSVSVFFGLGTWIVLPVLISLFSTQENKEVIMWNVGAMLVACVLVAQVGYSLRQKTKRWRRLRT